MLYFKKADFFKGLHFRGYQGNKLRNKWNKIYSTFAEFEN